VTRTTAKPKAPTIDTTALGAAAHAVVRLARAVERTVGEHQLSLSQYRILDRLADGTAPGRNLAEWLAVKPPSITALVDGLVRRGLVDRTEDADDRRRITIALTPAGAELQTMVAERIAERIAEIGGRLGERRGADMVRSLGAWNEALDLGKRTEGR
jgi:DNA-binding MarR family transcriptional regulator